MKVQKSEQGFGLIELMVTASLMACLSTVALNGMVAQKKMQARSRMTTTATEQLQLSKHNWLDNIDQADWQMIDGCETEILDAQPKFAHLKTTCTQTDGPGFEGSAEGYVTRPIPLNENGQSGQGNSDANSSYQEWLAGQ